MRAWRPCSGISTAAWLTLQSAPSQWAIRLEGSQPWKVTQKVSPLKELVTNMLWYCLCKKPVIDPAVHQGRPGQGWYQCNLKYEHAVPTATVDKIIAMCILPIFTDRVVAVAQMRWFRCVCLVTWECRAALPLQHWPWCQPKRDFGTVCATLSLFRMAQEAHMFLFEQHQACQRLWRVWQELEFPPAMHCCSDRVTENWSNSTMCAGGAGVGTLLIQSSSTESKRTINEVVWHIFLTPLLSFCQISTSWCDLHTVIFTSGWGNLAFSLVYVLESIWYFGDTS